VIWPEKARIVGRSLEAGEPNAFDEPFEYVGGPAASIA
jgi:hypothetical protein